MFGEKEGVVQCEGLEVQALRCYQQEVWHSKQQQDDHEQGRR